MLSAEVQRVKTLVAQGDWLQIVRTPLFKKIFISMHLPYLPTERASYRGSGGMVTEDFYPQDNKAETQIISEFQNAARKSG